MLAKVVQRLKSAGQVLLHGETIRPTPRDIPSISPDEVAEAKTFFPAEKYFIYGHARSGTTLLTRLVRLHPEVHCNYQAHFFTRAPLLEALVADPEVGSWLGRNSNRWNHGRDLSPVVLRAVSDYIMERESRRLGKRIVGDKSPNSLLDGEAVHKLEKVYPDARLVYIVRDGRDAALSHRFQAFIDTPQRLNSQDLAIRQAYREDPEPFQKGERSIFTEKSLRNTTEGWVKNVTETDQAGRERFGDRYHCLRYEDLLASPREEMRKLWEFLGADTSLPGLQDLLVNELKENPDKDWQQQKSADIAGSLTKGQRGTWRELFTPRDRLIFKEIAGETLVHWGYEKDLDW